MAKVCQLFSGSSGNSIYIGGRNGGILVDIGVSAKRCAARSETSVWTPTVSKQCL